MFNFFRRQKPAEKAALSSAQLEAILAEGMESSAGVSVTTSSAMRVATVYACVRILAESIAQLPLKVYGYGRGGDKIVMIGDPLYTLLHHSPNSWMTSFEFWELVAICLCLRGNFYAYIVRDSKGAIVELLPIRPADVTVKQDENWALTYTIIINKTRRTVAAADIFHVRGMSLDGLVGMSPIGCQRNTIGMTIATENHGARTFRNGARPGGVLTHPGKLTDDALKHLRASWQATHGGENAGGTAIIEEGMTYHPVAMSNEDAQLLETRQFQRTEICSIFRVPPHMVGDLTKSSFSNITQQSLEFVKYTILPWSRRIEAAIYRDLLTDGQRKKGVFAELLVDGLERADIETRYKAYNTGIMSGILSPNECRAAENRNAREGGDIFLQPMNMTDGTKPAADQQKRKSKAVEFEEDDFVEDEEDGFFLSDEVKGFNLAAADFRPKLMIAAYRSVAYECEHVAKAIGKIYTKDATQDFLVWLASFYEQMPKVLTSDIAPLLTSYARIVNIEASRMAGGYSPELTPELDAFIQQYVEAYTVRHCGSSIGQMKDIVAKTSPEMLAPELTKRVAEWRATRAGKIAENETIRFAQGVARESWKNNGVKKLRWVAQGRRSCPFCRKLHGKIVGIEDPFLYDGGRIESGLARNVLKIKGNKMHPPIHRGCVCAIVPELGKYQDVGEEEFAGKLAALPDTHKPFLTLYTPEEYRKNGARLYLSETRDSGYGISGGGELVSVFSCNNSKEGNSVVLDAVKNGASTLDCFNTTLPELYSRYGFKEQGRVEWNDLYAPAGWDYEKYGKPDLVTMKRDGGKGKSVESFPPADWPERLREKYKDAMPLPKDAPQNHGSEEFQAISAEYIKDVFG